MSRAYTVATIALALGTSNKWVDNALSHYRVSGVQQTRQGIRRTISVVGVLELSVSQDLLGLGVPLARAIMTARRLVETGEMELAQELRLQLDIGSLKRKLEEKLEFAVEAAPLPKRGRPPGKAKRGA